MIIVWYWDKFLNIVLYIFLNGDEFNVLIFLMCVLWSIVIIGIDLGVKLKIGVVYILWSLKNKFLCWYSCLMKNVFNFVLLLKKYCLLV